MRDSNQPKNRMANQEVHSARLCTLDTVFRLRPRDGRAARPLLVNRSTGVIKGAEGRECDVTSALDFARAPSTNFLPLHTRACSFKATRLVAHVPQ